MPRGIPRCCTSQPEIPFRLEPLRLPTPWRSSSSPCHQRSRAARRSSSGRSTRTCKATQDLIESTQARADALIAIEERTPEQEAELQALEGRLASLRSTYTTLLSFSSGSATNLLTVVDPAVTPVSPVLPRTLVNTLLAAALALLVIAGVAFVVEQLDDSIKDPDAVEEVAGLSTLGSIVRMQSADGRREMYQLAGLLYPRSSAAEAYRTLRANIEFASVDTPLHTLLVTSAASGEGKTVTASNLAVVIAQTGRTVLLVDADLRKPAVHRVFDLPNTAGLTTILRDEKVRLDTISHVTEQPGLRILTSGPLAPNPAELLGSNRMQGVLGRLRESAELVIFDSPPLHAVTDAAVISSFVDGTLLVIDAGRSRRRVVRVGREALSRAGANVLGVVLNRVPARKPLCIRRILRRQGSAHRECDPGRRHARRRRRSAADSPARD